MSGIDDLLDAIGRLKTEGNTEENIKQMFDDCLAVHYPEVSE